MQNSLFYNFKLDYAYIPPFHVLNAVSSLPLKSIKVYEYLSIITELHLKYCGCVVRTGYSIKMIMYPYSCLLIFFENVIHEHCICVTPISLSSLQLLQCPSAKIHDLIFNYCYMYTHI